MIEYVANPSQRSKKISIAIQRGGRVVLTYPVRIGRKTAEEFLSKNQAWVSRQKEKMKKDGRLLFRGSQQDYLSGRFKAQRLVQERLLFFNRHYGFRWKKIVIRNQSSRWGSASVAGNLNFNWRIILLPSELADYLVVHEMCHLKEMNHSVRFWALVAQMVPHPRRLSTKLRRI